MMGLGQRYVIEDMLGQGGMGVVYKAFDRLNNRHVALKQLIIEPLNVANSSDNLNLTEFHLALAGEFRILSSLRHPNVVSVFDYGFTDKNQPFFTMEYLENSKSFLDAGQKITIREKVDILIQLAQALAYLHRRNIIHRDLKPDNVMITNGVVKTLDFGLAVIRRDSYASKTDRITGTFPYIAPELFDGYKPTRASDLWAFGIMAYELIASEHPFDKSSLMSLVRDLMSKTADVKRLKLDTQLENILEKLLESNPDDRYHDAFELIDDLFKANGTSQSNDIVIIRDSFLTNPKFVGRHSELQKLENALDSTLSGTGSGWLIGGESGVGKSRLIDELRSLALIKGFTVLRGQGISEGGLSFQLWQQVMRNIIFDVVLDETQKQIFKEIIPGLPVLLNEKIEDAIWTKNNDITIHLSNTIFSVLKKFNKPLLILLEDLQWADESLEPMKQLMFSITQLPIVIVGTYRDDEKPDLPGEFEGINLITLKRLAKESIIELSEMTLGKIGAEPVLVDMLIRETEGNCFFLVEVMTALAEKSGGLNRIMDVTIPDKVMTGGMEDIINHRVSKLNEADNKLLKIAAVSGKALDLDLLQFMLDEADFGVSFLEQWLTNCAEYMILELQNEQWRFTHDKIREHILSKLVDNERIDLYSQLARSIEQVYANELTSHAAMLAQYFHYAKDYAKEEQYRILAAEHFRIFNPPEAYRQAKQALFLHGYTHTSESENARLRLLIAQTALSISEYAEVRETLNIALEIYSKIGDEYGIAKTKNRIGELAFKTSNFEGAIDLLNETIPVFEDSEDWTELGMVYMNISIILARQGEIKNAMPYFKKCLDTLLLTRNDVDIAKAYNNLAIAWDINGDAEKGLELHHKAMGIRRRINDKNGLATSLQNLAGIESLQGNYEKSRDMRLEALTYAQEVASRDMQIDVTMSLGMTEYLMGNQKEAVAYLHKALDIAIQIDDVYKQGNCFVQISRIHFDDNPQEAISNLYKAAIIIKDFDIIPQKIEVIERLCDLLDKADKTSIEHSISWLSSTLTYGKNYENFDRIDSHLAQLKAQMPEIDYQSASEYGKTLSLNDVIEQILAQKVL